MPKKVKELKKEVAAPDGTSDREWAERVAARLRGEFGSLVASLNPAHQRATAMARRLELQVPLCHRIVAGVRESGGAGAVLAAFPGVEGLRIYLAAARGAGCAARMVSNASGAVDEFEALIARSGGSQRRLVASLAGLGALDGRVAGAGGTADLSRQRRDARRMDEARRRGFEALVDQLGCVSETLVAVRVYSPAAQPLVAEDLDVTAAIGRVGFTRTSAAMPFLVGHQRGASLQASDDAGSAGWSLMPEFCTPPLPKVVLEERGKVRFGVVDPSFELSGPMDIFAGPFTGRNVVVREGTSHYLNASTKCSSPAEWLVTDVYVPREWSAGLACAAGAYRAGNLGDVIGPVSRRWFDRLPILLTPGLLGRGLVGAAMERFDRHADFTARVFAAAHADPADFVGFRLAVQYPMLEVQYVLSFEQESGEGHEADATRAE